MEIIIYILLGLNALQLFVIYKLTRMAYISQKSSSAFEFKEALKETTDKPDPHPTVSRGKGR
jgi:hypothetical protein